MHDSILKILLVLGADEYLERLEGKIRKWLFFYVKIFWNNSVPELSIISDISEQKNDKFYHCAIALCSPMLRKRLLTILVYYIVTPCATVLSLTWPWDLCLGQGKNFSFFFFLSNSFLSFPYLLYTLAKTEIIHPRNVRAKVA